jgi:hypothetical protein
MSRMNLLMVAVLATAGCAPPTTSAPLFDPSRREALAPQRDAPGRFAVQQRSGRRSLIEGGLLQELRDWRQLGPPAFRNYAIYRSGYQYPYYYGAYYPYSSIYDYGLPISPELEKELEEQAEAAASASIPYDAERGRIRAW